MTDSRVKKYIPDSKVWLRAAVSAIPHVGGPLDHLIFDKADSIRAENLQAAIAALGNRLDQVEEASIDKAWFESQEALATFRLMAEKVAFEPDRRKIADIGRLVAACGMHPQSADPRKLSVMDHISRLSPVQVRLLSVIAGVQHKAKKLSGRGLAQTLTGIWPKDIESALRSGERFWNGDLNLALELEILESLNTIRRVPAIVSHEVAFSLTVLGRHSAGYVHQAGL